MHTLKRKLVVSQVALACALAFNAQANAATNNNDISNSTWNTYTHYNDSTNADGVYYQGYANWLNTSEVTGSDIYPSINNATVNGVISTYYLDDGLVADGQNNSLTIKNSTVHGMVTSACMTENCVDGREAGYNYDRLALTVDNSTIDDNFEHYTFDGTDATGAVDTHNVDTYALGTAITLDQETDLAIANNSHVAGITLTQGYDWVDNARQFTNNINISDSVLTSGSLSDQGTEGWFGRSDNASDYANIGTNSDINMDDVALAAISNPNSDNGMITVANLSHSTLTGDVLFSSNFDRDFYPQGTYSDGNTSGVVDTNGWNGTDGLTVNLDNGSKWTGAAFSVHQVDTDGDGVLDGFAPGTDATATLLDVTENSLWPDSTYGEANDNTAFDSAGHVAGNTVYQSGLFNVNLNNGSEWDTRKDSLIDNLTLKNGSKLTVQNSSLVADNITLNNGSDMTIQDLGVVAADSVNLNSNSTATLSQENAELYANKVMVDGNAQLNLGLGQLDTANLQLTNGGTFNVGSRSYDLNGNLVNGHTNDTHQANYGYGVVALNSDGHLAVNGDVAGNYKVQIDDATGRGSKADYQNKELIRIYDNDAGTAATFSAANRADLGAYTYQAVQQGDSVVLKKGRLTDSANIALSIPSANTNISHLQQDTLSDRLTNGRHGGTDNGGAWVSYFGGHFNGNNDVINYKQSANGVMVGLDTQVDGNNAKWMIGAAAGLAKGDISKRSGQVDQDSQSAYLYSSARFANNIFIDGNLSYSRFNNDLTANTSNGDYVDGNTASDAFGFGLKLGYDWNVSDKGYVTPYGAISGLFQSADEQRLSNNLSVSDQSYDSMRYELGVDAGYTMDFGDQSLTPYAKLAYVYDDSDNNAEVNGDHIDNGVKGSAVRVGLGTQFNLTQQFSAYAGADYLGGGDVDQNWGANAGVKYTW